MTDPLITAAQLRLFAPHCDGLAVAPALDAAARAFRIDTPRRVRHFMAQTHVESAGFTRLEESLTYTHWEALHAAWPAHFPTEASARPFLMKPATLAELVYGQRLGNHAACDGWNYRGRGFIQITGRANYGRASTWTGLDLVNSPDMAAQPKTAAVIAAAFWDVEGLNELADADAGEALTTTILAGVHDAEVQDLKAETQKINGGLNGWPDRERQLQRAAAIWKD